MKKLMMLAAMLALVATLGVVPALADHNDDDFRDHRIEDRFDDEDRFDGFFFFDGDDGIGFDGDDGIGNSVGQEAESGEVSMDFSVSNTGDYAFQCTPALQFGNTGNLQNANAFLQYASEADDFEGGGIEFAFAPEQATECSSTIQQSAAASGW